MSYGTKWEYLKAVYPRYRRATRADKRTILNEFCETTGYHRKYALRYDTPAAVPALNDLYRHDLRLFQTLFLPSVKLLRNDRVRARVRRRYDVPRPPLERVQACPAADPATVARLVALRDQLDPFTLAQAIDRKLERLMAAATPARGRPPAPAPGASHSPVVPRRRPPPPRHLKDFTFSNHLRRPLPPRTRVTS